MSFYQPFRSFSRHEGLPFADLLSESVINKIAEEVGVDVAKEEEDGILYTTPVTLWAFLSQMLFKDEQRSCVAAVARVITLCIALNREPPSPDTGTYCRARARLPVALVQRMTTHVAEAGEAQVPNDWLWKNRHVYLVDGTTVSTPDTPELQKKYPQPDSQKEGLGFPMIRMVVLMSLATAMLTGMAQGPYAGKETGETALFRELLDRLKAGDVVLADRYYCSYFMIALLKERNIDAVFRLHQARTADFTKGKRLGSGDHIVTWHRPDRPEWMSQEVYDRMPLTLEVREVMVRVSQPGFREDSLIVVTTMTDSSEYSKDDLAELYHKRWLVELDIGVLKVRLGLGVLRTTSPAMARKELWVGLLAYNLIRQSLLQAASLRELSPRQLSFTAAMQSVASTWSVLAIVSQEIATKLIEAHLHAIGTHKIGHRFGRVEPRAIKRRPKPQALLTKPRQEARAELLKGRSAAASETTESAAE